MEWLNYLVLGLYVVMLVLIAVFTRHRGKTLNDFFFAGKGLGGWMTAFAYGTTYFSAVVFIGYAGKFGWNYGLSAVWIGVGNALIGSYLAWKILAKSTRNMTRKLGVKTMPEFFEQRYRDPRIKLFASLIIFVFLIPYSASVYQGLGYIFEAVFHIDFNWVIVIMAALTGLYLVFGGYFATALSDFIQGIIMLAGIVIMVAILLARPEVNFLEGVKELAESGFGFLPAAGSGGILDSPLFNVVVLVLLTSFGVWGLPQIIHKFYAVKDNRAIRRATVVSTLFALIIGSGAYFVGGLGHLFFSELPNGNTDYIVPTLMQNFLPNGLIGVIVVLLLSASMSTLASLSLAGSSAVAVDLYQGYLRPNADEKKVNLLMKIVCLGFVLVSALLAIAQFDAIVTLMSLSWGTLAGCFVGPYIYGVKCRFPTRASAWASLISGLVVTVAFIFIFGAMDANAVTFGQIVKAGIARSPLIGVIAMAVSMAIVPLVSLFTKKLDRKEVEAMFEAPAEEN